MTRIYKGKKEPLASACNVAAPCVIARITYRVDSVLTDPLNFTRGFGAIPRGGFHELFMYQQRWIRQATCGMFGYPRRVDRAAGAAWGHTPASSCFTLENRRGTPLMQTSGSQILNVTP